MISDAQAAGESAPFTTSPGNMNVADCFDTLSPSVEALTLEDIDIADGDFSCPTPPSGPSAPAGFETIQESTQMPEATLEEEKVSLPVLTASNGAQTECIQEGPMHKHSLYFWESILFKVEGITFQLPKYRFAEESDEFMRVAARGEGDGPIELDVTLGDFEAFLKVFLLPRASAMYDEKPALTKYEWISVLRLSTKWLFNDLRKLAISHLSLIKMDAIDRICLAKEYWVYNWLLEGYEQVVDRLLTFDAADGSGTTLTAQEGKRIGMEVALELSGIVIRRMRSTERKVGLKNVNVDVLHAFKKEFDHVQDEGARFMTRAEHIDEEARKKSEGEKAEQRKEVEELNRKKKEAQEQQKAKDEEQENNKEEEERTQRLEEEAQLLEEVEKQLEVEMFRHLVEEQPAKARKEEAFVVAGAEESRRLAEEDERKQQDEVEAKQHEECLVEEYATKPQEEEVKSSKKEADFKQQQREKVVSEKKCEKVKANTNLGAIDIPGVKVEAGSVRGEKPSLSSSTAVEEKEQPKVEPAMGTSRVSGRPARNSLQERLAAGKSIRPSGKSTDRKQGDPWGWF
ncbi:hypothetical protein BKA70DRAFT_1570733 [Coprinopsis sp. MPI-PUGE-AT-0042]|nr:hypothetical protein BKA70DRAFT_1570733 [Coprinopsis sp. MPI-PUGE-AT-0042]